MENLLYKEPEIDETLIKENNKDDVNEEHVNTLIGMGFNYEMSVKSLKINKNDIEKSLEWLFNNNCKI